jgi:hypothetical protein
VASYRNKKSRLRSFAPGSPCSRAQATLVSIERTTQWTISPSRCATCTSDTQPDSLLNKDALHLPPQQNAASQLERDINSWAASLVANPPADLQDIRQAALIDIFDGEMPEGYPLPENPTGFQMQTLNLLRHALAKTICDGIVNCLIVTDSAEANIQLTRIHEHIFSRKSRFSPPPTNTF